MSPSIVSSHVAWSCPWFDVIAKDAELSTPRGLETFYSVRIPDQVVVLAITDDGRIPLVRQYRPAIEDEVLELPSGGVEPGEKPADAALRELLEETGCEAAEADLLGNLAADSGRLDARLWAFFVPGARCVGAPQGDEPLQRIWATPDELSSMVRSGELSVATHLAVLAAAHSRDMIEL